MEALTTLCQDGGREGGLYLVKASQSGGILVSITKNLKQIILGPTLRSYTPACGLLEAGLQDTLTLQVGLIMDREQQD